MANSVSRHGVDMGFVWTLTHFGECFREVIVIKESRRTRTRLEAFMASRIRVSPDRDCSCQMTSCLSSVKVSEA
jgi:hypothetical protein